MDMGNTNGVPKQSMGATTLAEWCRLADLKEDGKASLVAVSPSRYELISQGGHIYGRYDFHNAQERWISEWWPHVNC